MDPEYGNHFWIKLFFCCLFRNPRMTWTPHYSTGQSLIILMWVSDTNPHSQHWCLVNRVIFILCVKNTTCIISKLRRATSADKDRERHKNRAGWKLTTCLFRLQNLYGCSVMNDILHFYLETVLPSAISSHADKKNFKTPIDTIGNLFQELKRELVKCVSVSNDFVCFLLAFCLSARERKNVHLSTTFNVII